MLNADVVRIVSATVGMGTRVKRWRKRNEL